MYSVMLLYTTGKVDLVYSSFPPYVSGEVFFVGAQAIPIKELELAAAVNLVTSNTFQVSLN